MTMEPPCKLWTAISRDCLQNEDTAITSTKNASQHRSKILQVQPCHFTVLNLNLEKAVDLYTFDTALPSRISVAIENELEKMSGCEKRVTESDQKLSCHYERAMRQPGPR
ncbi:uncharacterized protein LOC116538015 [Sapajus apella]|uniref:Uncharacterized protein LOC116538015 n=1 Tax=Sapajus apella TaxID=9515 RepID=A0A6J3GDQ0_SAPAP|nr:uncharacterized protein LOC116538015 [Sapajus apella]